MSAMTANADFQRTAKTTQAFREVAEKGAAETKENLGKMAAAGGEAVHVLKDAYATNLKALKTTAPKSSNSRKSRRGMSDATEVQATNVS
jgi:hypothetical protein